MSDLFRIGTNTSALKALLNVEDINTRIVEAQERLATGKLANKASDDPANFFAARKFESSISAFVAGQKEIERGIDFLETNLARLDQISEIIVEMISLANTANSGSITSAEQQAISREMTLLVDQIGNILSSGVDASIWTGFTIGNLSDVSLTGATPPTTSTLSLDGTNLLVTGSTAQFATTLTNLNNALTTILDGEQRLGSYVKRLEFELEDLAVSEIAARSQLSTIEDADLAEEQVNLTALQILQQTSIIGLIQANNAPASILGLIGQ